MGDLNELQSAQVIKIAGSDSAGAENYFTNVTSGGRLMTDTVVTNTSQNYLYQYRLYSLGIDVSLMTSGTANPAILIRNPANSGKNIYIYKIAGGVQVANVSVIFTLYSMPTISSNGSTIAISSRFINSGAGASAMLITSLPTASALGTSLMSSVATQNSNSVVIVSEFSIGIAPGGSLLITGNPTSSSRTASFEVAWAEEPV